MCGDCIVMQESHSLDSYQFSCKAAIHICQSAWNKGWALCGNYLAKRNESMSANMLELYGSCLYFLLNPPLHAKCLQSPRHHHFFPFFPSSTVYIRRTKESSAFLFSKYMQGISFLKLVCLQINASLHFHDHYYLVKSQQRAQSLSVLIVDQHRASPVILIRILMMKSLHRGRG